ncbi:MAG TPA: type II toxin-antitoxin system VapC family toxin [Candidatus Saccharimonadales bacterium]|nr:type II toxin-antitoxin system VapC family toxin [Candidatus Saccharimonadales bacterium]
MTAKVLDSWALMAFFKGEPSGEMVEALIHKAAAEKTRLLLCVVNWGEIYYAMWRAGGEAAAEAVAEDLSHLPVDLIEADLTLSKQAARFKAVHKMSYADCFAAALAKMNNCELLTGDLEFKEVEKEIKIVWLIGGAR